MASPGRAIKYSYQCLRIFSNNLRGKVITPFSLLFVFQMEKAAASTAPDAAAPSFGKAYFPT